ncbi:hypothetical protein [Microbacterium sp. lyk4-40-TSB-66]|uniref:hypothetical protein n=1 Tax=Microbacterium sp. lyk4-40-TSB-66 TaxID=3040294 RepID=UPI00254F64A6|nr:hypothetical protein [Microbacterium sp. lyk4-40-TSB-66]
MTTSSRRRLVGVIGLVFSALVYAGTLFWALLTAAPGPLRAIRKFAWHDQLGYLSMVSNVSDGDLGNHEPVTETGVNHYPRAYYTAVGLVARILGLEPITAWNLVSLTLQLAAVVALALCLIRVSRRSWAGFFAPLPFFTGVLAFTAPDGEGWYRPLSSHAVLWGPYGVMFSNNAETAGLCLIIVALSALAAVWLRPTRPTARAVVSAGAMAVLGVLSSFQTYSFLTGAYVVAFTVAAMFLVRPGRRWWVASTVLAVPVLFVIGPVVATSAGQLPTLVLGMLPAVPGLIRGVLITRGRLAACAAVFAVAAAPQILWTLSGIREGDPFLTYRVASNVDLGVARPDALFAATVVALPLFVVLAIAIHRRVAASVALTAAAATVWVVLSLNDLWGANAEPYRFWIDCFLFCGVLTLVAGANLVGSRGPDAGTRRRLSATKALAAVCALVYVVGLSDLVHFTRDTEMLQTWNPDSPNAAAAADLARSTESVDDRLLMVDHCLDDRTIKATSGAAMVFYYLGMAWPENRDAVQEVMDARFNKQKITPEMAEAADVGWLLLDSRCTVHAGVIGEPGELVAEREYAPGQTLQLRRLP